MRLLNFIPILFLLFFNSFVNIYGQTLEPTKFCANFHINQTNIDYFKDNCCYISTPSSIFINMTDIPNNAFKSCTSLTQVTIGNGVQI